MGHENGYRHGYDRQYANDDWDQVHNDWLQVQRKEKENAAPVDGSKQRIEIASPDSENEKQADEVAKKVTQGDGVDLGGMTGADSNSGKLHRKKKDDEEPVFIDFVYSYNSPSFKTAYGDTKFKVSLALKKESKYKIEGELGKIEALKMSMGRESTIGEEAKSTLGATLLSADAPEISLWGKSKISFGASFFNVDLSDEVDLSLVKFEAKLSGEYEISELRGTPFWVKEFETFENRGFKVELSGSVEFTPAIEELLRMQKLQKATKELEGITKELKTEKKKVTKLRNNLEKRKKEIFKKYKRKNPRYKHWNQLPPEDRKIFEELVENDKTYREIAEKIETSKGNVKRLAKVTEEIGERMAKISTKMSTKLGKIVGKTFLKSAGKLIGKAIPIIDVILVLYDIAVLIKFRDYLSGGTDSPELWDDVPDKKEEEGTEGKNGDTDGNSDQKREGKEKGDGTGDQEPKKEEKVENGANTENTDGKNNKNKHESTHETTNTDKKTDNAEEHSQNGTDKGKSETNTTPKLKPEEIFDRFSKESNPVKGIVFTAVISEGGIEVDSDLLDRFLQLNFGTLKSDSPELTKVLEQIKSEEGTLITDKERFLTRLQEILDGKTEEKKDKTDAVTNLDQKKDDQDKNTDDKKEVPVVQGEGSVEKDKKDKKEEVHIDGVIIAEHVDNPKLGEDAQDVKTSTIFLHKGVPKQGQILDVIFRIEVGGDTYDIKGCQVEVTSVDSKSVHVKIYDNFELKLPNGRILYYGKGREGTYGLSRFR